MSDSDEHSVEDCFRVVHSNLQELPDNFCYWRKESADGRKIPKTLNTDYRPIFSFVHDYELRNNLAELRMCLDYHRSVYEFLQPTLTFGWQHKIVLCQLAAAIYEGILLDLFEYKTNAKSKGSLPSVVASEKLDNPSTGLGYLIEVFYKSGLFTSKSWRKYLDDIKRLRDTVHPKSLNSDHVSYEKNTVVQESVDELFRKLDAFIVIIQKQYR